LFRCTFSISRDSASDESRFAWSRKEKDMSSAVLPKRLADFGFSLHNFGGVEAILPPLACTLPSCLVPAGEFLMGSHSRLDPNVYGNEPLWRVSLPNYSITRFPVTVAEYACFVRHSGKIPREDGKDVWTPQLQHLDCPVTYVSMNDAKDYTKWLAQLTRQPWRLPTEAEWEKAACWDGYHSRLYPWGDEFIAWNCYCGKWYEPTKGTRIFIPPNAPPLDQIHKHVPLPHPSAEPVGMRPGSASPCGAEDMVGNVSEVTMSISNVDIMGDGSLNVRGTDMAILRGGNCMGDPTEMRAAHRAPTIDSDVTDELAGFRMVYTPVEPFDQCVMYPVR